MQNQIQSVHHHQKQDMSELPIREVKDGQQPALCADGDLLSRARQDDSIIATFMWQPAHPPPRAVKIAAKYPTFARLTQLEDTAAFTLLYSDAW
jgi:hypothetical protein